MLSITDLKTGTIFSLAKEPGQIYEVLSYSHSKQARGGAVLNTKIRNLKTGKVLRSTFKPSDKFEEMELDKIEADYLYQQGSKFVFMNNNSFEQFELTEATLANQKQFLKENLKINLISLNNEIIAIELPIKIAYEVKNAPPVIKNATISSGASKKVKLENGLEVEAPMFIKAGQTILVDTRTREYAGRSQE